jgi:Holliday junction resolvase
MDDSESKLQRKILDYLDIVPRCKGIKVISANERGIPDIHVCYRGTYYVFEVKANQNKATALQRRQLTEYKKAGAITAIVRNVDDIKKILDVRAGR